MWEDWFKWLLGGCLIALGWYAKGLRGEVDRLWGKVDEKEDKLHKISLTIAAEYVTKRELQELKREIKEEMRTGFEDIKEQIKTLLGK